MIVVSDTSPLHYLILIGHVDLLPALFGSVYAPPLVIHELSQPQTPPAILNWIAAPPAWLVVQAPRSVVPVADLDPGEAQAIALAQELSADTLLMDDRDGVKFARKLGLEITGTLGVLILAKKQGLLASLRDALQQLAQTNFRRAPGLFADALRKYEPA